MMLTLAIILWRLWVSTNFKLKNTQSVESKTGVMESEYKIEYKSEVSMLSLQCMLSLIIKLGICLMPKLFL